MDYDEIYWPMPSYYHDMENGNHSSDEDEVAIERTECLLEMIKDLNARLLKLESEGGGL